MQAAQKASGTAAPNSAAATLFLPAHSAYDRGRIEAKDAVPMLTVISPAKTLDFDTPPTTDRHSQPAYLDQSQLLIDELRTLAVQDVAQLMKLSDKLASLNVANPLGLSLTISNSHELGTFSKSHVVDQPGPPDPRCDEQPRIAVRAIQKGYGIGVAQLGIVDGIEAGGEQGLPERG